MLQKLLFIKPGNLQTQKSLPILFISALSIYSRCSKLRLVFRIFLKMGLNHPLNKRFLISFWITLFSLNIYSWILNLQSEFMVLLPSSCCPFQPGFSNFSNWILLFIKIWLGFFTSRKSPELQNKLHDSLSFYNMKEGQHCGLIADMSYRYHFMSHWLYSCFSSLLTAEERMNKGPNAWTSEAPVEEPEEPPGSDFDLA